MSGVSGRKAFDKRTYGLTAATEDSILNRISVASTAALKEIAEEISCIMFEDAAAVLLVQPVGTIVSTAACAAMGSIRPRKGPKGPQTTPSKNCRGTGSGRRHHRTGVEFDTDGYPMFEAMAEVFIVPTGDRMADTREADRIAKELGLPFSSSKVATWHHHQCTGLMQLVDWWTHAKTSHKGGFKEWGKKFFFGGS